MTVATATADPWSRHRTADPWNRPYSTPSRAARSETQGLKQRRPHATPRATPTPCNPRRPTLRRDAAASTGMTRASHPPSSTEGRCDPRVTGPVSVPQRADSRRMTRASSSPNRRGEQGRSVCPAGQLSSFFDLGLARIVLTGARTRRLWSPAAARRSHGVRRRPRRARVRARLRRAGVWGCGRACAPDPRWRGLAGRSEQLFRLFPPRS